MKKNIYTIPAVEVFAVCPSTILEESRIPEGGSNVDGPKVGESKLDSFYDDDFDFEE